MDVYHIKLIFFSSRKHDSINELQRQLACFYSKNWDIFIITILHKQTNHRAFRLTGISIYGEQETVTMATLVQCIFIEDFH